MEIEKAIEILKGYELQIGNANMLKEPLQITIEAAEKQVGKKPKTIDHGTNICPVCQCDLLWWYSHCPYCGTKIDWVMNNEI